MHVRYISAKQCGAYVDIVPTIYARYFKFITVRGRDCISLDLFGNEAGKIFISGRSLDGNRKGPK